ncbi:hypothetical protein I7H67_05000 [Acinetobacter sp. ACIN00229]|uniref:hypothetical protein n=1 Tax=Acinetobacter sp. ACIN00229 TaxID=2792607 RepID=UPI0018DF487B|nr:hypothetical protein [Acinetobacter sp. ACIN00229]MBI0422156.1 hypothetical protein [Acinetobacter sp. ACIN00229]
MRTLTLEEMNVVAGAASDTNKPVTSSDFRSALIGWSLSKGMDMAVDQVNAYVAAYEKNGLSGVAAASPAGKAITTATSFLASLNEPEDGNEYCADGGNY